MKLDSKQTITSNHWIFRLILAGLLAQLLLSSTLWFRPAGVLEYLPLFSFGTEFWQASSVVLFPVFIIIIMAGMMLGPRRWLLGSLLIVAILLVVGNIHRLQVWFYFYLIVLSIYLFINLVNDVAQRWLLRSVFILIYSWSGIHKLNVHFSNDIFPWLLESTFLSHWATDPSNAIIAGLIELGIGIGLAMAWSRRMAVIALGIFHLGILYVLGPLGHDWNVVVWPWNVLMPMIGFGLFYPYTTHSFSAQFNFFKKHKIAWVLIPLVGWFPMFNFFGITPEQLSFKMYAGSHPEVVFYFDNKDKALFKNIETDYNSIEAGLEPSYRFQLDEVSFIEFGTPLFTTKKTARKVGRSLCNRLSHPELGGIWYLESDPWNIDGGAFEKITCEELLDKKK